MIQRKFFHFNTYEEFSKMKVSMDPENTTFMINLDDKVWDGEPDIPYRSIVFIKDRRLLVTHGQVYDTSGENLEQLGDLFISLADFEVSTVFDSVISGSPEPKVEEFIEYVEAGTVYYNNLPDQVVNKYSGFSLINPEAKILSRYPMEFQTPSPRQVPLGLSDVHPTRCVAYVEDTGDFYMRSISYQNGADTYITSTYDLIGGVGYTLEFTVWTSGKTSKINPRLTNEEGKVVLDFGEISVSPEAKKYTLIATALEDCYCPFMYFDLGEDAIYGDWIRYSNINLSEKDLDTWVSEVKVAQYMESLSTESGFWVYSLRYFPMSPFDERSVLLVNCGIYE